MIGIGATPCPACPLIPAAYALLIVALTLELCGGSDQSVLPTRTPCGCRQQPRGYLMGFSSLPVAPGDEAYETAFQFIGQSARSSSSSARRPGPTSCPAL